MPTVFQIPKKCTIHFIRTAVLEALVLEVIRAVSGFVKENEDELVRLACEAHDIQSSETARSQQKQLAQAQKRHKELDSLIKQLYEDKNKGELSVKRFEILSGTILNEYIDKILVHEADKSNGRREQSSDKCTKSGSRKSVASNKVDICNAPSHSYLLFQRLIDLINSLMH